MIVPVNSSTKFSGTPLGCGAWALFFMITSPLTLVKSKIIYTRDAGDNKYYSTLTSLAKKSLSSLKSLKGILLLVLH